MNSDFKELLTILNDCEVRYLVVGGYAYIHYAIPFISLADLITAKRTAGREQDLRDIAGLERVLGGEE
jgi:hypothetical protein